MSENNISDNLFDDDLSDIILFDKDSDKSKVGSVFMDNDNSVSNSLSINSLSINSNSINSNSINSDSKKNKNIDYIANNICDYCFSNQFVNQTYAYKFIDKCIKLYKKNNKKFMTSPKAHMLGSLIELESMYKSYLKKTSLDLASMYHQIDNLVSHDNPFVTDGIIIQYLQRVSEIDRFTNEDRFRDWLIVNNIACDLCKRLACRFHFDHGAFDTMEISGKKLFCCGWCHEEQTPTNFFTMIDCIDDLNEDMFDNTSVYVDIDIDK